MTTLSPELQSTYEVLEVMGGGMGTVYKVRHRLFGEVRIIKVMQAALKDDSALKERFSAEARRGKQLKHDNIAGVLDFFIGSDGNAHLVMEYVDGVNLREAFSLTGQPLDPRNVVIIGVQTLAALGYLHSKNLIHRDISPDNLMLTTDKDGGLVVKLIDLGIAKSLEDTIALTQAGSFMGKLNYASPEQFGGEVDARSDFYSLGIVLYELLTAAKPIIGANTGAVIMAHYQTPPRPFSETDPKGHVPESLRHIVLKALEKNPEDRYQTADEFATALRGTLLASDLLPTVASTAWLTLTRDPTQPATRPPSPIRPVTTPAAHQPATQPATQPPSPPLSQPATYPGAYPSAQRPSFRPGDNRMVADSYAIVRPAHTGRKGTWQLIAVIACVLLAGIGAIAGYERLRSSPAPATTIQQSSIPSTSGDNSLTAGTTMTVPAPTEQRRSVPLISPAPAPAPVIEPVPVPQPPEPTGTVQLATSTRPVAFPPIQPPALTPTPVTLQPPPPRLDVVEGDRQRRRAIAFSNAHQWQNAVSAWRQFIRDYSGFNRAADHAAFYNLGVAYEALLNWNEAIDAFERAVPLDDTGSDTANLLRLARCYGKVGRWNDAVTTYEQVLRIDPGNDVAKKNLIPALQQAPRG